MQAAFEGAVADVVSNEELALDEKIRAMESIITASTSDFYKEFVDFGSLVAQMQTMCAHDHALTNFLQENSVITDSGFNATRSEAHDHAHHHAHDNHAESEEVDTKTGKKTKKKKALGWLGLYKFFHTNYIG